MEDLLAPHILELNKALNGKLAEDKIKDELKRLADYKVPIEEAKRLILRKYSASPARKLSELKSGDRDLEITAKVLDIKERSVKVRGVERTIFYGMLVDETHARSFTAWDDPGLAPGDVVKISGVHVRSWQDRPEINISNRSQVTKLDPDEVQFEIEIPPKKLAELKDEDVIAGLTVVVLDSQKKEINTQGGVREITTGVVADETARLPFTDWTVNPEIKAGATLGIENAYIRSFRGVPTLNISETSKVTAKAGETIEYREKVVPLGELTRRQGAYDVLVEGSVLSVRPGSGLIVRCPVCSRVIQKGICRVHSRVEGVPDMRVKAILDDGTGALTLVLDARLTEEITGCTLEEAQGIARKEMSSEVIEEKIREKLVGNILQARGNMSTGEYGATLVASQIEEPEFDAEQMARELLEEIGAGAGSVAGAVP